jgi:hypothetical protein
MRQRAIWVVSFGWVAVAACANDPLYLDSPTTLEAGVDDGTGTGTLTAQANGSLMLSIKPETASDASTRMALAAKLGIDVPYVKVGDIDIEVEYTIKNLDTKPGQARVDLNGANEYFVYDPTLIVLNPGDDEAPPTPPLSGDIPVDVPAMGQIDGVFREDQLLEASIDCDQVTRGHVNPFAATLKINKNDPSFQPLTAYVPPAMVGAAPPMQDPDGPIVPRSAFAELIRIDIVFKPDRHMTMDYTVRVRDHRGIVDLHGTHSPMAEVVQFAPATYAP